ncbi:unnamed protein product [Dibothriocephalus latus]|uniref:Uncharacterized protein n=1 Tax=Dibothriocephalus latus TaxID=60516 RepID=A0A3P7NUL4_DIBLA|nr:unnamed protein product [Dibothriocephalus latus]
MNEEEMRVNVFNSLQNRVPSASVCVSNGVFYFLQMNHMNVSEVFSCKTEDAVKFAASDKVYFNCTFHVADLRMYVLRQPLGARMARVATIQLKDVNGLVAVNLLKNVVKSDRFCLDAYASKATLPAFEIARLTSSMHVDRQLARSIRKQLFEHSLNCRYHRDHPNCY